MSTPRKSTSSNPATPRRPYTPESQVGRSPRAPSPPSFPDRRSTYLTSPDKPTKSYLRPTVSSTLHHGNTTAPRRSIDRPPFLPPSSVGINSVHHKTPSSNKGTGTLSLKNIFTKANNALKVGRKSGGGAGGFGSGSTSSTPVRPRNPALVKKKEGSKSYARSNNVPKKMEVMSTRHKVEETETVSIHSIEYHLHEQFANPIETPPPPPRDPEFMVELTTPPPKVEVQEPVYNEKIDEVVNEEVEESSIVAIEEKPEVEEKHEEIKKVEEIEESSMENDKVIEECREEQMKVEEEVNEKPTETEEEVVIVETQEEEVPKVEETEIVKDMNLEDVNNVIEDEEIKEPELMVVKIEEEIKDEEETKEESQETKKIEITMSVEAPKEESENQVKVEKETPAMKAETKVENVITEETPKEEKPPVSEPGTKIEQIIVIEEILKEEEKPTTSEIVEKRDDPLIVEAPKVEKVEKRTVRNVGKKPNAVAAKKDGGISNDVIEETRSKLLENRKSKVLALVGAFETVMQ